MILLLLQCCQLIQTGDDGNKSSGTVSPLLKQSQTLVNLHINISIGIHVHKIILVLF